ncbi:MAG: hypothetical protein WBA23_13360 [Tunicatimonas sp.]|uniref:hypothetical protein n=1 Tax=Tunicatimonas sp. TaxID=1940096 RepID=UPI003C713CBA
MVRTYLAEDSLAVYQQISHYLQYFDNTEDIFIALSISKRMPKNTKGMTYCAQPVKSFPYQIIRVRIADGLSEKERNEVLAHEMIHVKQYVKGELELLDNHRVRWMGKTFRNHFIGAKQRFSPWEKEAYRTETLVTKVCQEQLNNPLLAQRVDQYTIKYSWEGDSVEFNLSALSRFFR